jgi:hypothetical protein
MSKKIKPLKNIALANKAFNLLSLDEKSFELRLLDKGKFPSKKLREIYFMLEKTSSDKSN